MRSEGAQPEEGLQGLSVVEQQPINFVRVVQTKNSLPLGQIGWNDEADDEEEEADILRKDESVKGFY